MIHQGHMSDFVVCVLITSNLGQSPKNLLYSSFLSAVHTSVDFISLFELAEAPYVSWEHKEHLIFLMALSSTLSSLWCFLLYSFFFSSYSASSLMASCFPSLICFLHSSSCLYVSYFFLTSVPVLSDLCLLFHRLHNCFTFLFHRISFPWLSLIYQLNHSSFFSLFRSGDLWPLCITETLLHSL